MRPQHRGAYEHLWSEQKYAALAISSKRFQIGSRRLGAKPPKILSFLDQLSKFVSTEQSEFSNAWLTAYSQVKDRIPRDERRPIIEALLAGAPSANDRLYEQILEHHEAGLYGCRLFFPRCGSYKFWDFHDLPGLWQLMGPYLLHTGFGAIRTRLEKIGGCVGTGLDERLEILRRGISLSEFETWPETLCKALKKHVMVAIPGERVWLHPRVELPLPAPVCEPEEAEGAAIAALETFWDENPEDIPLLPEDDDWLERLTNERLPGIDWIMPEHPLEVIKTIRQAFREQSEAEGRSIETEVIAESSETNFDYHDDGSGDPAESDFSNV
ncbi:MAG: hypothetical protein HQM09_03615 [Candidatus Riflebacteria bacterium]|nr:hypothetical protein [Candidatus Riflebacteria bacterium]